VYVYRRAAEARPDGAFVHLGYWWGLLPFKARTLPNSFIKVFMP
jgi:hypothetical protein